MNRSMKRKAAQTRRNALLVAALMLVVCIASIGGTIAWLTDSTGPVNNTFTPSNIDIKLEETVPANQTAKMVPGDTIAKDPKVTVLANSEPCWVFVKITENIGEIVKKENEDGTKEYYTFDDFIDYKVNAAWKPVEGYGDVYYYEVINMPTTNQELPAIIGYETDGGSFVANEVFVNTTVTKGMMDALKTAGNDGYPKLSFTAYAIQKASFGTAKAAWEELVGI